MASGSNRESSARATRSIKTCDSGGIHSWSRQAYFSSASNVSEIIARSRLQTRYEVPYEVSCACIYGGISTKVKVQKKWNQYNLLSNRGTRFYETCGSKGAPHLLMTFVIPYLHPCSSIRPFAPIDTCYTHLWPPRLRPFHLLADSTCTGLLPRSLHIRDQRTQPRSGPFTPVHARSWLPDPFGPRASVRSISWRTRCARASYPVHNPIDVQVLLHLRVPS